MPENIIIQEMLVENGLGQKIIPIYFSLFHIPNEIYQDKKKNSQVSLMARTAMNKGIESSLVERLDVRVYGMMAIYVASSNKKHTRGICEAILKSFNIDYVIK